MEGGFLERWLEVLLATPGLTAISDPEIARRLLVEDALRAETTVRRRPGTVVDVGSGGGSPGIPLAYAIPDRRFTLLEAERRKCDFLSRMTEGLTNVEVVWGRAEEQSTDAFGVALAKALAKPPVAAELCLPLVREGGIAMLWVGETASLGQVARSPSASPRRWRTPATGCSSSARWGRRRPASRAGRGWRRSVPSHEPGSEGGVRADHETVLVPARVYAVANQKGGVGKTTTAVNVGACLAEAGERVLLVDLDPQANATSGLGMRANGASTHDLLDGVPLSDAGEALGLAEPRRGHGEERPCRRRGRALCP